jgi:hypothetical protein
MTGTSQPTTKPDDLFLEFARDIGRYMAQADKARREGQPLPPSPFKVRSRS